MTEKISPYSPYPYGFRGDIKKGSYCEVDINEGKGTRFIIIRPKAYFPQDTIERDIDLIKKGISTLEDLYPDVIRLGYIPDRLETFWLYNLNVCDIDKVYLEDSDSEVFAANVKYDEYYTFDDFYKCMDFVKKEFGVNEKDFKKDWETSYPQY
ncbi:hypothetical protein PEC301296_40960 [Pectobacterium carotovorum subsp. carotovorum]|nr:hypothetical protein CVS35_17190 [Pectobacterium atrosepticum]KFX12707.1 hypothetical protein JV34_17540 [Pectobacterium atrosepticum]KFX12714.1 hypothetical protein JV34_17575 [Pectobacterium atrosepticum]KMK86988.1 hypothetical protein KCQ_05736 [Pectobacterium atrosepticum ICMP 1526]GKV87785.1 hypothetical protein PEC301296_40960 [Pectobacterium carotovorum subsp. carotovorum]